jgi:hypothetical protein
VPDGAGIQSAKLHLNALWIGIPCIVLKSWNENRASGQSRSSKSRDEAGRQWRRLDILDPRLQDDDGIRPG